jgi:hypothetical protein
MMKRVVYLLAGPYIAPGGYPICADTDHDSLDETIFFTDYPTHWAIWEYRSLNQYQLVYADTGIYPYPPGITTGNFRPEDVGDIDNDSLFDLLGPNVDKPLNSDTFYNVVTTQESPSFSSYPESLSWWYRFANNMAISEPFYFTFDLDNDCRKEIVVATPTLQIATGIWENVTNNQNELVWYRAIGSWSFGFGDFDLDGRKEFATANLGSLGRVSVYENTGNDQYEMIYQDTVRIPNGSDVFSGNDLDGDGKPEFFVAFAQLAGGNAWDFYLYMWEATGNNTYERTLIGQRRDIDWSSKRSKCGDIDGDGIEEIVWSIGNRLLCYKATGNNQFELIWSWLNDHGGDYPCAVVNVYDVNKNGYNEIIVSGWGKTSFFEVEAVWLRRPNGGENFTGNTQEQIRWQKFYPPRCDSLSLFYSLNNGRTYDTIITGLPGADSSYLWTVPDTSSDSCKVKIIAYGPGWQYDESDGVFTITPSGIEENTSQYNSSFRFEVHPNPSKAGVRFQIQNAGEKELNVKIYNLAGESVKTFTLTTNHQKTTSINWDAKDKNGKLLPNGIYFIECKSDKLTLIKRIILLK